jgi:DNA repair exonuclease SbcCD ATPase subunit
MAMKIVTLEVEGFGPFAAPRRFTFAEEGVNIIFGPNESGKSTLMEAILATVFGFAKKGDEGSFRSWGRPRSFAAVVEFKAGDGLFRISRDFDTNEVSVLRTDAGKTKEVFRGDASARSRGEERREYASLLQELFGFSDGGLARKTTFVGQLELETELTPELRGLISGAGPADFQKASEVLEERFEDITVENPWGTRKRRTSREIEKTQEALRQARERLGIAENFLKNSSSLKTDTGRFEESIRTLKEKRDRGKGFLEKLSGLVGLQESLKDAEKLLDSETKARREQERIREGMDKSRQSLSEDFRLFGALSADIAPLLTRAVTTEDELAAARQKLAETTAPGVSAMPVAARPGLSPLGIGLLSGAMLLVFLLAGHLLHRPLLLGLVGVLASAVLAILLSSYSRARAPSAQQPAVPVEAARELREKIAAMESERRRLAGELLASFPDTERPLAEGLGVRQLSKEHEKYQDAKRRLAELEQSLPRESQETREAGHSKALNSVADIKLRIQKFVAEANELLALKNEPDKAAAAASGARAEIKSLESTLQSLESELLEKQLSYSRLSATEVLPPEACEEEIELLEKTLSGLLLRRDALKLAVETLRECVRDYQAHSVERLSERISTLFGAITEGRYKRVRLSEDFEPELEADANPSVPPSALSTGAMDQLYFCMRMAFLEELTGEKGLPLILDDPFVNFDEERLERARKLLLDLAGQRGIQVILFTHGERPLDWDAHLIRLDAAAPPGP